MDFETSKFSSSVLVTGTVPYGNFFGFAVVVFHLSTTPVAFDTPCSSMGINRLKAMDFGTSVKNTNTSKKSITVMKKNYVQ
jgi:hypothetical protein